MNLQMARNRIMLHAFMALFISTSFLVNHQTQAAGLSPEIEKKVALYKKKLEQWSKDQDLLMAVKKMNKASPSMNNAKWKALAKNDPTVLKFQTSAAGKKLSQWQQDKSLGKLFLRDKNGNLVAGSKKPAIFNIGERKAFTKVSEGSPWHSKKIKADPTTNQNAVQISIPVMSNGQKIGVLHTALIVE